MAERYCFYCGHRLKKGDIYCTNCGANQKTRIIPGNNSKRKSQPLTRQEFKQVEKLRRQKKTGNFFSKFIEFKDEIDEPIHHEFIKFNQKFNYQNLFKPLKHAKLSPKKRRVWLIMGIGGAIVLFSFFAGMSYYSRSNQLSRISAYLENPNQTGLVKYITTGKSNAEINSSNIKPFQLYLKTSTKQKNQLIKALTQGKSYQGIKLIQEGYYLVYPKYKLLVPTYNLTAKTNHPNSKLYLNNRYYGVISKSNTNYSKTIRGLFFGQYQAKIKTKVAGRNLTTGEDLTLNQNKQSNLDIKTLSFTIKSVPYGKVYINDKLVAHLNKDGIGHLKSYPINSKTLVYVKYNLDNQTVTSDITNSLALFAKNKQLGKQLNYKKGRYILEPSWAGLIKEDDAQDLLECIFNKKIKAKYFNNGSNNSSYQDLKKMIQGFDKDSKIRSYKMKVKINRILPLGNATSRIDYEVTYIFKHKKDTRTQVLTYTNGKVVKSGKQYVLITAGQGSISKDKTKKN